MRDQQDVHRSIIARKRYLDAEHASQAEAWSFGCAGDDGWLHKAIPLASRAGSHRTCELPNPVLLLILPKSDGPSPRSSESYRLLAPPPQNDDGEAGPGEARAGRNRFSASQSYIPAGGPSYISRALSRVCLCIMYVPSPPNAAPVQNPGRQLPSLALAWLDGGCLE